MNNIFEGAKFRDQFLTRDGHIVVFYDFSPDKEVCRLLYKGEGLMMVYTNNGAFYQGNHDNYDIVSRYQEQIDEEKLDELADKVLETLPSGDIDTLHAMMYIKKAYKAGYRKGRNKNDNRRIFKSAI